MKAFALVLILAGAAHASPATDLGEAYAAYDRNDLATARARLAKLDDEQLVARDYAVWLRGMVALHAGDSDAAIVQFVRLGKLGSPRYGAEVPWRIADATWQKGNHTAAAKLYAKLIDGKTAETTGDVGTAMWRIAETRTGDAALAGYRAMAIAHPAHPMAATAEQKLTVPLTAPERILRAQHLTDAHEWDAAVAELARLDALAPDVAHQRDYWLGITLFKMRRRYGDAGTLLLDVYRFLGDTAAEAMFHGARALSRADRDDEAIQWYAKVVASYPTTAYAKEAQFLIGWLEFNRGHYQAAIAPLEKSLANYPRSKFADDSLWFLGMSHYFLGEWEPAKVSLTLLAKRPDALEGGKGQYWLARIEQRLGNQASATAAYTQTIRAHPFSWYALLARARLAAEKVDVTPFGGAPGSLADSRGPKLLATVDESLATDDLIRRTDELTAAGLGPDSGDELARGEKAFLKRHASERAAAFALLLDRYRKAGNYNRPWLLAVSYSGNALDGAPTDDARRWWENAYPRAYRDLVEKYEKLGDNPSGYLYSIMRKESGFNPHDLSYADAQGLLQMIPPTTQRVAKELKIPYDEGRLYEPEYNIETASWYVGHLLAKFKTQIPLGAGSFNSGPRPVMKWVDQNGTREIDEFVELVPYTQTREYMKKVTENVARYRYLYDGTVYEQPLAVEPYIKDQLTY